MEQTTFMPQLNIYLDETSEKAVWAAARKRSLSLSKWAREVLVRAAAEGQTWPENYSALFGSIQDESFRAPDDQKEPLDQSAEFDL